MNETHTSKRVETPPGIDAPGPAVKPVQTAGPGEAADVERDLRRLANLVGGFPRLRELIDELAATR